jgi:hypothetical protein
MMELVPKLYPLTRISFCLSGHISVSVNAVSHPIKAKDDGYELIVAYCLSPPGTRLFSPNLAKGGFLSAKVFLAFSIVFWL